MNIGVTRPVEILLVEDNPGDVFLTRKAFEKANIPNNIQVAEDGEVALAMLRHEHGYENIPTPDIVLLDMNLPKIDGKQVLAQMKQDDKLRRIPAIVLTSSSVDKDILASYDLHANGYIVKPINLEKFHEVVTAIEAFWFNVAVLPAQDK